MTPLEHADAHERLADLALEPGALDRIGSPNRTPSALISSAGETCRREVEAGNAPRRAWWRLAGRSRIAWIRRIRRRRAHRRPGRGPRRRACRGPTCAGRGPIEGCRQRRSSSPTARRRRPSRAAGGPSFGSPVARAPPCAGSSARRGPRGPRGRDRGPRRPGRLPGPGRPGDGPARGVAASLERVLATRTTRSSTWGADGIANGRCRAAATSSS
jgi:hypothetical protein